MLFKKYIILHVTKYQITCYKVSNYMLQNTQNYMLQNIELHVTKMSNYMLQNTRLKYKLHVTKYSINLYKY